MVAREKHEERVSWTHFRQALGETAPERGRRSDNRWLCSRDRRRDGPVPPGGNVERCPCTDHLGTEASGHQSVSKVHSSGGVLPSPTGPFSSPHTFQLTSLYWGLGRGGLLPGRWLQGWLLQGRFLEGRR